MSDEHRSPTEAGMIPEPLESLGGKDLPMGWPAFPPVSQTDGIYRTFKRGEEFMVNKYSYYLALGDKRLRYLAAEHQQDPNHPQYELIKQKFTEFKPQVVLLEGQLMPDFSATSEAEAVEIDQEVGFARYLVDQHNAALAPGEEPIKVVSGDIPNALWITELQKLGYSMEDIAVYNLARSIYSEAIQIDRNESTSEADKAKARQDAEARFRKDPVPFMFLELPRADGKKWKPKRMLEDFRKLTGQEISLDLDYTTHPVLSKMREEEVSIRDLYQVKQIEEAVRNNDRVFAMMGGAHPVRQEAALRQLFDNTETAAAVGLPKSLGGIDLPPDWPSILPENYVDETNWDPANWSQMHQYSYELTNGDHRLLYLAAEHSRDPEHPQFELLRQKFDKFNPQVVLYEGPVSKISRFRSEKRTISTAGEKGFLLSLVREHNASLSKGEESIQAASGDIPDAEWVEGFQRMGYSNEDIAVFDLGRQLYGEAIRIENHTGISQEDKVKRRKKIESQFLKDPVRYISSRLPRADGQKWTSELLAAEVHRLTGQSISLDLDYTRDPQLRRMFEDEDTFREVYQVKKIEETVRGNQRVLVLMGSAHPMRQEVALEQLFDSGGAPISF